MIGEGVLIECLAHPTVTEVLSVSRKPSGISHPKLTEYIIPDFLSLKEPDEKLMGYDACFFCAGVTSMGKSEAVYRKITYDTTLHFAKALNPNPDMSFVYVSGAGTDSSEKGRLRWARVKGKTENDLMKLPFKQAFGYRIGFVEPTAEQDHLMKYFSYISWLYPVVKFLFPSMVISMQQLALSMIYVSQHGYERNVIEVKDIHKINSLL